VNGNGTSNINTMLSLYLAAITGTLKVIQLASRKAFNLHPGKPEVSHGSFQYRQAALKRIPL
jgi:hypothetical protein